MRSVLPKELQLVLQEKYNRQVASVKRESGGCINDCYRVMLEPSDSHPTPLTLFIKTNSQPNSEQMFVAERKGLEAMQQTKSVRVPKVFDVGSCSRSGSNDSLAFLIMEYIPMTNSCANYENLATQLAKMHLYKRRPTDDDDEDGTEKEKENRRFGFACDNFIGSTPQPNAWQANWIEFYQQRLRFQLELLREKEYAKHDWIKKYEKLIERMDEFFDPQEEIEPSLLHGDLWSGNWSFTTEGEPVLFDPAAYYGHYEAELAMMTMFGAMPPQFYTKYFSLIKKSPRFEQREALYQLYHALNHFNLFGSGYRSMCDSLLARLMRSLE